MNRGKCVIMTQVQVSRCLVSNQSERSSWYKLYKLNKETVIILNNKLYIGGLPFAWGEDDLRQLGEEYGAVASAIVIMDRETNRSKGFGFLEFENEDDAKKAQSALDGSDAGGRKIKVDFARPQKER